MAEIVTVLSMATTGFKLAKMLFNFAEAVGSTDKEIRRTAKDVSFFSDALSLLAPVLERGREAEYITKDAFDKVQGVMDECKSVFQELEAMIEKSTKSEEVIKMGKDDTVPLTRFNLSVPLIKRLLYYFQRGNLEAVRARLESLKSTLHLMLSTLMSAERFERVKKIDPHVRADSETAKLLRTQDELRMECLVLTNEAAAAEVRKLDKPKVKSTKTASKNTELVGDVRPSIAAAGVFSQLSKKLPSANSDGLESKPGHNAALNPDSLAATWVPKPPPAAEWGPTPLLAAIGSSTPPPAAAADKAPGESKIEVQETSQVVLALLALWVSNGAQLAGAIDQTETTAGMNNKSKKDEQWEADWESEEEEEPIDLFPRRESRPYAVTKDQKDSKQDVEEEPIDMYPRRGPRPY